MTEYCAVVSRPLLTVNDTLGLSFLRFLFNSIVISTVPLGAILPNQVYSKRRFCFKIGVLGR